LLTFNSRELEYARRSRSPDTTMKVDGDVGCDLDNVRQRGSHYDGREVAT
jgi:hypothetical protein